MKKKTLINLFLLLFITACTNRTDDLKRVLHSSAQIKATLNDGRLHFTSEQDLKTTIEHMKSLEDREVENLMYDFYKKDFAPLYPFYRESDEERISQFVKQKQEKLQYSNSLRGGDNNQLLEDIDFENDDDLIHDDYFASLLNDEREIVVGGKLYKYTHNGAYIVALKNQADLKKHLSNIRFDKSVAPDPKSLQRGLIQVTPTVQRFAPPQKSNKSILDLLKANQAASTKNQIGKPDPIFDDSYDYDFGDPISAGSSGSSGSSSGGGSNGSIIDHTNSMLAYVRTLEPCHQQNAWISGAFGLTKKCYSYHSSKHRVKTKLWNQNFGIYTSLGVKVKHQKKRKFLGWGAKKTDEVALIINEAIFSKKLPNQTAPESALQMSPPGNHRLYHYGNRVYDRPVQIPYSMWGSPTNAIPQTPFSEDIIVQEAVDLPILRNIDDITIEARELNKLFWEQGVWENAKRVFKSITGETPKRVTYLLTTPQKSYIYYADLSTRRGNTKKIKHKFDDDWGGEIKISFGVDGQGNWTTSWDDFKLTDVFNIFSFTNLTEYEFISLDFVGLTRRGNSWKGSKMVFKAD